MPLISYNVENLKIKRTCIIYHDIDSLVLKHMSVESTFSLFILELSGTYFIVSICKVIYYIFSLCLYHYNSEWKFMFAMQRLRRLWSIFFTCHYLGVCSGDVFVCKSSCYRVYTFVYVSPIVLGLMVFNC